MSAPAKGLHIPGCDFYGLDGQDGVPAIDEGFCRFCVGPRTDYPPETHEPEDAMGGAIDAGDLLAFVAWLDLFRPDTFSDLWAEFQGTQDH